jgi:hypothetical protein
MIDYITLTDYEKDITMLSNFFGDVPFVPEPGEQVIGQYKTHSVATRHQSGGDVGALIVTTQRVLFFRREGVLKKLFKSDAPGYKLSLSLFIGQILKIKHGSTSGYKFLELNGSRFYLEGADPKAVEKILKKGAKSGSLMQPGQQAPAGVPSINQITRQPAQQAPAATPQAGGKICTYCGVDNKADGQFCKSCGARMQG